MAGSLRGYTIPLNAPLYKEPPWFYRGARVAVVLASFKRHSVEKLLPEGIMPLGDPVMGAFWVSEYPFSTLGPYHEAIVAVQVEGEFGLGYYIPYIYVTNDAAMAAGREVLGAPKKLASIILEEAGRSIRGAVERAGGKLFELEVELERPGDESFLRSLLPEETLLLGLRVLPAVGGKGLSQLVLWYVKSWLHRAGFGPELWAGTARLRVYGSVEDPLDKLEVAEVMGGFYAVIDMELGVKRILWEKEVA